MKNYTLEFLNVAILTINENGELRGELRNQTSKATKEENEYFGIVFWFVTTLNRLDLSCPST